MANRKKKPVIGSLQPDVDSMLDWNTLTSRIRFCACLQ